MFQEDKFFHQKCHQQFSILYDRPKIFYNVLDQQKDKKFALTSILAASNELINLFDLYGKVLF